VLFTFFKIRSLWEYLNYLWKIWPINYLRFGIPAHIHRDPIALLFFKRVRTLLLSSIEAQAFFETCRRSSSWRCPCKQLQYWPRSFSLFEFNKWHLHKLNSIFLPAYVFSFPFVAALFIAETKLFSCKWNAEQLIYKSTIELSWAFPAYSPSPPFSSICEAFSVFLVREKILRCCLSSLKNGRQQLT